MSDLNKNIPTGSRNVERGIGAKLLSAEPSVTEKLRADLAKSRPFPGGTIIAWHSVSANGIHYQYAAIFVNGHWYTTLQNDNQYVQRRMSHQELIGYFADRGDYIEGLRVATDFEEVSL